MPIPDLLAISVGLAMDALAVSIAISILLGQITARRVFRIAFHFGLFQALMPVVGWLAGRTFSGLIEHWDHWLAFAILAVLGLKMILESARGTTENFNGNDPSRGVLMVGLSLAVSIDALAVGLSFALLDLEVWLPATVIGLVTLAASTLGMLLGKHLGNRFGRRTGFAGGLVLLLIGIKIVLEHTLLVSS